MCNKRMQFVSFFVKEVVASIAKMLHVSAKIVMQGVIYTIVDRKSVVIVGQILRLHRCYCQHPWADQNSSAVK